MEKQSIWHLHLNIALAFHLFSTTLVRCEQAGEGRAWLPESEWVQETEVSIAPSRYGPRSLHYHTNSGRPGDDASSGWWRGAEGRQD